MVVFSERDLFVPVRSSVVIGESRHRQPTSVRQGDSNIPEDRESSVERTPKHLPQTAPLPNPGTLWNRREF